MQKAQLFMDGKCQAVRLPKQFRFKGQEVYIRRLQGAVMLIPKGDPWESLLSSLNHFSDDFMQERNQP